MSLRTIAGVFAGCVLWWVAFLAIGIGFGLLWPAYRAAARAMFADGDFSHFTTPMLFLNFVVFICAGLIVGWLVSLFTRSWLAPMIVALIYLLLMAYDHYYLIWDAAPAWYNLVVPLIISGSIAAGGRILKFA